MILNRPKKIAIASIAVTSILVVLVWFSIPSRALENSLNLRAWNQPEYTVLNWDKDLNQRGQQFNVYRLVGNNDRQKLNDGPYGFASFTDFAAPGQEIRYQVAVTRDGAESYLSEITVDRSAYADASSEAGVAASNTEFYRHDLITQCKFEAIWTMDVYDIQAFLDGKGGYIRNYWEGGKRASQIISDAANDFNINPEVILVKLQQEQSLVTATNPSQYALDWAMGYHVGNEASRGFKNQVRQGTERLRQYMTQLETDGHTVSGWAVNQWKNSQDPLAVKPANKATAGLYTYTPWVGVGGGGAPGIGGNYLFWNIYRTWFSVLCRHPAGTFIKHPYNGTIYLVETENKITPFNSYHTFITTWPNFVIPVSESEINSYILSGSLMPFADGNLVRSELNDDIYVISNGQKRHFVNRAAFDRLGYDIRKVRRVPNPLLSLNPTGAEITEISNHPDGTILQTPGSATLWLIANGQKRYAYQSPGVFLSAHKGDKIIMTSQNRLNLHPYGGIAKFGEYSLARGYNNGTIYLIYQWEKRAFSSWPLFSDLKYYPGDIFIGPDTTLNQMGNGSLITGDD